MLPWAAHHRKKFRHEAPTAFGRQKFVRAKQGGARSERFHRSCNIEIPCLVGVTARYQAEFNAHANTSYVAEFAAFLMRHYRSHTPEQET